MSVFTALTRTRSGIDGVEFEAVLESTFTASVEMTGYPLESGVEVVDHALVMPVEYTMTILASNNPLQPGVTDFIGGAVSNFIPGLAGFAGAFAGLLSSAPENTSSAVLGSLVSTMIARQPVTLTDGDIVLSDMMITNITRTSSADNEGGLECELTLQELPRINRITIEGSGNLSVSDADPAKTKAGKFAEKGYAKVQDAGEKIRERASDLFSKVPYITPDDSAGATG